ncbi:hypothetical protein GCM10023143_00040 [Compostibacter hankyongensis]|uniref:Uncharacterized protein n=1 Tax=Compostibacter hankyongensis TaxID=1007089 RepID=A0ABP8FBE0_9BACT
MVILTIPTSLKLSVRCSLIPGEFLLDDGEDEAGDPAEEKQRGARFGNEYPEITPGSVANYMKSGLAYMKCAIHTMKSRRIYLIQFP